MRRAAPGTGVTVQSASEIQEMKRLRKEQKKAIKHQKGDRDENEVSADILGFETENWKAAREEALSSASQRPLFSSSHKVSHRRGGLKLELHLLNVVFSYIQDCRADRLSPCLPVWKKWKHTLCVWNTICASNGHCER